MSLYGIDYKTWLQDIRSWSCPDGTGNFCSPVMFLRYLTGFFLALFPDLLAIRPIVELSYATYQGTSYSDGVSQWLGMRYAEPPLDELRFAAPGDPRRVSGVQSAAKYGKYCLAVDDRPPTNPDTSEDCLFLDVYSPSDANSSSKLPVFFFIQGGGFAMNSNGNFNGRGLVKASDNQIVVVTSNYRVGPYGFIAGEEISSSNNGIKDQRKALEWVQRHITAFGGNPEHVVLGGDSAGAASITIHLTAHGGRNDGLFHGAAAESQSFAPVLTNLESEYQYKELVIRAGCASSYPDTLSCLRSLSSDEIQAVNTAYPYPGAPERPLFSWNPVVDGDLIQDVTYRAFNSGAFIRVPTIFGDDTNGGTIFAPRSTATRGQSNSFLYSQFPHLTLPWIKIINDLYPNNHYYTDDNDSSIDARIRNNMSDSQMPSLSLFPNSGSWWRQSAAVYGDMRYMCPGLYLSDIFSRPYNKVSSWNYRFNVEDPEQIALGLGVPHTTEVFALFGPGFTGKTEVPKSYERGGVNENIVHVIRKYWIGFIKGLDPNSDLDPDSGADGEGREPGLKMVKWEPWQEKKRKRLVFDGPPAETSMERVDDLIWKRCEFFWSIGVDVRQ